MEVRTKAVLAAAVAALMVLTSVSAVASSDDADAAESGYVMVKGIAGFEDRRFDSFKEMYSAVYNGMGTQFSGRADIHGQGPLNESEFKSFYTDWKDVSGKVEATLTYTVYGTVVYDESEVATITTSMTTSSGTTELTCKYLLSMGRAASHFGDDLHLNHFVIQGGDSSAKLLMKTDITLPYEWWDGDTTKCSISINSLELVADGASKNKFSIGQAYLMGADMEFNNVRVKGMGLYAYVNTEYNLSIRDSVFDGSGVGEDVYAVHCQGNGPRYGQPYTGDWRAANIHIENSTFSGYDRGINIDQINAEATIKGCTVSNTDTGRSSVQITQCSKIDVTDNTFNVVGNAITLHNNLKNSAGSVGTVDININNNRIKDASADGKSAHLLYVGNDLADSFEKLNLSLDYNIVDESIIRDSGVYGGSVNPVPSAIQSVIDAAVILHPEDPSEPDIDDSDDDYQAWLQQYYKQLEAEKQKAEHDKAEKQKTVAVAAAAAAASILAMILFVMSRKP